MNDKINVLFESSEGPRVLSKLMLELVESDWNDIFYTDIEIPDHILAHIKKYFSVTKNETFISLICSVLSNENKFDIKSDAFYMGYKFISTKNKFLTDSDKELLSSASIDSSLLNSKKKTSTKSTKKSSEPIKETKDVLQSKTSSEVNQESFDIKMHLVTKFGFISTMQVGVENNELFSGLFVSGSNTFFIKDNIIVTGADVDDNLLSSVFEFLKENGILMDPEVHENLWILTKKVKENFSFKNKLNINFCIPEMNQKEKETFICGLIKDNIDKIFGVTQLANFVNNMDSDYAVKEFARLGIKLDSLLSI